jgi:DNA-binding transcriptional regulator YhcF (GntR family)
MSGLVISVDLSAAEPPFEQVRAQIADRIAHGDLAEGDRLPTVRGLAADLGLAVNTVARAYRELELQGLVVSRVRHGTTVADHGRGLSRAEVARRLAEAARVYALTARQLGAANPDALEAVRSALRSAS